MIRRAVFLIIIATLSGCSSVIIPGSNGLVNPNSTSYCTAPNGNNPGTINGQLCHILKLEKDHVDDARKLEFERGAYNLTTLAAAVVGASSIVFDWHTDVLKTAGLVAGGAQGINAYQNPGTKQQLLLRALSRLRCAKRVTLVEISPKAPGQKLSNQDDSKVSGLLSDAVNAIETTLLTSWIDASANLDYKTVIGNVLTAAQYAPSRAPTSIPINYTDLSQKLAACATQ